VDILRGSISCLGLKLRGDCAWKVDDRRPGGATGEDDIWLVHGRLFHDGIKSHKHKSHEG
jgi:hypothetical protein